MATKRIDLIPQYIMTACMLHNICMRRRDFIAIENPIEVELDDAGSDDDDDEEYENAPLKRDNIMNLVLLRNNFFYHNY